MQGRMPSDDKGREWNYDAACQGMPTTASKPLADGKR